MTIEKLPIIDNPQFRLSNLRSLLEVAGTENVINEKHQKIILPMKILAFCLMKTINTTIRKILNSQQA